MKKYLYVFLLMMIAGNLKANDILTLNIDSGEPAIRLNFSLKDPDVKMEDLRLGLDIFATYSNFGVLTGSTNYELYPVNADSVQQHFSLPNDNSFLRIRYKVGRKSVFGFGSIFLVEAGDSLQCDLYKDSVHFFGKGAEKMNLQYRLFSIINRFRVPVKKLIPATYFENEKLLIDKELKEQLFLLEQHKGVLSDKMYHYLLGQCTGMAKYRKMSAITAAKAKGKEMMAKAFEFYCKELKSDPLLIKEDIDLCSYYVDYLYLKEKYEYQIADSLDNNNKRVDGTVFIPSLIKKYGYKVLGKLLLISFSNLPMYSNGEDLFSLIDGAIEVTKEQPYSNLLQKIKEARASKSPAFLFALPDTSGNIVRMEDFRGKVVVLDFWFTGCMPCMQLATNMGEVLKAIDNKEMVVVSINVDKNKAQWKKSIKSGLYTHNGYVNLNTQGLSYFHPILNHYAVNGFPRLIIIDREGKVVTSTPPTPVKKEYVKELITLLKSVL